MSKKNLIDQFSSEIRKTHFLQQNVPFQKIQEEVEKQKSNLLIQLIEQLIFITDLHLTFNFLFKSFRLFY